MDENDLHKLTKPELIEIVLTLQRKIQRNQRDLKNAATWHQEELDSLARTVQRWIAHPVEETEQ